MEYQPVDLAGAVGEQGEDEEDPRPQQHCLVLKQLAIVLQQQGIPIRSIVWRDTPPFTSVCSPSLLCWRHSTHFSPSP